MNNAEHRTSRSYEIQVENRQAAFPVNLTKLQHAIRVVLAGEWPAPAEINLAIVDNATIQQMNRQFLDHDYPTDVISFALQDPGQPLEGDLVVSAEMAEENAREFGLSMADELLLYAIHGTLHLVGYDDKEAVARQTMRQREVHYLRLLGIAGPIRQPNDALGVANSHGDSPVSQGGDLA